MAKVLVSDSAELLRHFTAAPFRRLGLDLLVAADAAQARALFDEAEPALVILDADFGGPAGRDGDAYALTRAFKERSPASRVILVAGKRLGGDQLRAVTACGCDELLIAPMTADELHDVVSIQLGEPRPGSEPFAVSVAIPGGAPLDAKVSNLSVDGARLVLAAPLAEGQAVLVTISPEGHPPVVIRARVAWAQARGGAPDPGGAAVPAAGAGAAGGETVAGVAFDQLDDAARAVLARLTQWELVQDGERTRVVLRGDFTEATRFDALLPAMVGRVVFDVAQVTYMNSLGVRAWCEFLRAARIQGYEFHACSMPFVLQASMVRDVVGRGTVTSFFAPYHCVACDHQEERLLQSAALLASGLEPPGFKCPSCGGALEFDDLPDRYFAFLQDDPD